MFTLKWGKQIFQVSITPQTTAIHLMQQVEELTGVKVSNQKLMAKKGGWKGVLSIDSTKIKVKPGKTTLTLMGSAATTIHAASKAASQHQPLYEEDVRTAVRRSAEARSYFQKKRQKEREKEEARSKTFVETCAEEEVNATKRKNRLLLICKWRKRSQELHNRLQTTFSQWTCTVCTVENFAAENKCHVCKQTRATLSHHYKRTHHTAVVLPPLVDIFGLEGFSGTTSVAAIRTMIGSRYSLDRRDATFEYVPRMLEGTTLCGSSGSVCDGDVESAFACSMPSRVIVAVHPNIILRGAPEFLLRDYDRIEDIVITDKEIEGFGLYCLKQKLKRGDVFECIAMRPWSEEGGAPERSRRSLCLWFVADVDVQVENTV